MNFAFLLKWLKKPFVIGCLALAVALAFQTVRASYHKGKSQAYKLEIKRLESHLDDCADANKKNNQELNNLELEYYKITNELATAKKNQKQAVDFVNTLERESRDKINELQSQIKSNDICFVDAHNVSLLQKANRQN